MDTDKPQVGVQPGTSIKIQIGSDEVDLNKSESKEVKEEKLTESTEKVRKEEIDPKTLIPQGDYRNSNLFREVADYFRLDERRYEDVKYKLSYIIDWVILKTKSNKIKDVLKTLSETEHQIPGPHFGTGETRHTNFYKFLRLSEGRSNTNAMWKEYEKEYRSLNG